MLLVWIIGITDFGRCYGRYVPQKTFGKIWQISEYTCKIVHFVVIVKAATLRTGSLKRVSFKNLHFYMRTRIKRSYFIKVVT